MSKQLVTTRTMTQLSLCVGPDDFEIASTCQPFLLLLVSGLALKSRDEGYFVNPEASYSNKAAHIVKLRVQNDNSQLVSLLGQ